MKGFVFTLDAVFALLIAAASISVLLYFVYEVPTPYQIQYSSASGLISQMAATRLGSLTFVPLVNYIAAQEGASAQVWQLAQGDQMNSGGNENGPSQLTLAYVFNTSAQIANGTIVSSYGNVYFASSNTIYALNISSGNPVWEASSPSSAQVTAELIYGQMLIYATPSNVVALNAKTGATIWGTGMPSLPSAQVPSLFLYQNKLIAQMYDSSNGALSLTTIYANNGIIISTSQSSSTNPISKLVVVGDQIVEEQQKSISLVTGVYNSSYSMGTVWSYTMPFQTAGLSAYQGTIGFGTGPIANVMLQDGQTLTSYNTGSNVYGVSAYGGHMLFLSGSSVTQFTRQGTLVWQTGENGVPSVPSSYGNPVINATPIMSLQNVYTLWSGKYILVLNLSTGDIVGNTTLPYSGSLDPYMALSSGRLFVSQGTHLMVFGSCAANPSGSVLAAIGTMYVNGEGSCADYLLDNVASPANYSFTVNGIAPKSVAYFAGSGNYISAPQPFQGSQSCNLTVIAWSEYTGSSASQSHGVISFSGSTPASIEYGTGDAQFSATGASSSDTWSAPGSFQNSWVMSALEISGGYAYGYVNGAAYPSSTFVGCSSLGSASIGSNFQGYITNVQVYNSSLSQPQISMLYREGIKSPPISGMNLTAWLPLSGDTNSYAARYFAAYPIGTSFANVVYNSTNLQNSFSITSQTVPVVVFNYSSGTYRSYNMGVYSWR